MQYTKPFLNIPDQIAQLKSRGMQFADEKQAVRFLRHVNYVRLRVYWYSFEANHTTHQFKPNTTFEDVVKLYEFDRDLRALLLDALGMIEVSLRAQFAYHFARLHGAFAYTDVNQSRNQRHFRRNVRMLREEIDRSNEVFIVHYKRKYTAPALPPVWMACETMSLGLLSRWYKNVKSAKFRQAVARVYHVDNRALSGILHNFTEIRNVVAHHGCIWDRNIIFRLPLPQAKPRNLRASMNATNQDGLYNSLVMLVHFMRLVAPERGWGQQVIELIDDYQQETRLMGFPVNWRGLAIWQGGGV